MFEEKKGQKEGRGSFTLNARKGNRTKHSIRLVLIVTVRGIAHSGGLASIARKTLSSRVGSSSNSSWPVDMSFCDWSTVESCKENYGRVVSLSQILESEKEWRRLTQGRNGDGRAKGSVKAVLISRVEGEDIQNTSGQVRHNEIFGHIEDKCVNMCAIWKVLGNLVLDSSNRNSPVHDHRVRGPAQPNKVGGS